MPKRYDYRQIMGIGTGTIDNPLTAQEGCVSATLIQEPGGTPIVSANAPGATISPNNIVTCSDGGQVDEGNLGKAMIERAKILRKLTTQQPN